MKIFKYLLIFFLLGSTSFNCIAQEKASSKNQHIKTMLDNRTFTFYAETANPMTGGSRQLTSYYDVRVAGDSVISALPYFGRAYTAPVPGSTGGITFTTTVYDYELTPGKKGRWNVLLKFRDVDNVRQFAFTVYSNGNAILNVMSNNRQPISFNGRIR